MSDCGTHTYTGMTKGKVDYLRDQLTQNGATITGDNPWDIDTHQGESLVTSSVKLHAEWNSGTNVLSVTVTDKPGVASCDTVWSKIDPMMNRVQSMADPSADPNYDTNRALGQIASGSGTTTPTNADVASIKSALQGLDQTKVAPATTPAQTAPAQTQAAASAASAVSGSSKTALYVVGGAAVVGLGWLLYKRRRG